jgi:hypothetical protein
MDWNPARLAQRTVYSTKGFVHVSAYGEPGATRAGLIRFRMGLAANSLRRATAAVTCLLRCDAGHTYPASTCFRTVPVSRGHPETGTA